ncbi:putative bifunctional diguanylate cyclase/phosphodiesterase [Devosia sp. Leaf420]|uniref:putative bifunctional diguanylate cyclase/phosphodiesterase n=1 Tax=Devosia sp. Leaf420 TaxID=1736374 RepID=UPI000780C3DA|nr:bifunctional diguanylate cyclase/phosphodiesterase [Devosia sp. Leaf420]
MAVSSSFVDRGASAQIVWTSAILALCMAAVAMVAGWWAVQSIDGRWLNEERTAIETGIFQIRSQLATDQNTAIIVDGDIGFDGNGYIDRRLTTVAGHNRAYIIGPRGRILRASVDGHFAGRTLLMSDAFVLKPIIDELRLKLARMQFDDPSLMRGNATGLAALETVGFSNGDQGFISIRPIDRPSSEPGSSLLLVSIKLIDQAVIKKLGTDLKVANLHRTTDPTSSPLIVLRDSSGKTVANLTWTPSRPAQALLRETAPALITLAAFCAGMFIAILLWLYKTTLVLEASRAQATYLSLHDTLTGTANRALFERRLREAKEYQFLAETKVLLISVDVDHFKSINDTLGHAAGDIILKEVSRRLTLEMPEDATVARLGGDEFAVIHPGIISEGQARWICQRLVQCTKSPIVLGNERITITLSIGAALEKAEEMSGEEMLRRADVALYVTKQDGRDGFSLYNEEMDRTRRERRALEVELRNALITNEGLHLAYQPVYDAKQKTIAGAEALVRWDNPRHGRLSPDAFIALAEETGIIDQLGEWVLRHACRFALEAGLPQVAVNFSPIQFRNPKLPATILAVLAEEGLPPERLEVEITEGTLLQNSEEVQAALGELRSAGISVALDDFGTGYASISYLRSYAVDKLKIDKSYVQRIDAEPAIGHIVRLIVGTASALGMKVTAEGVEDTLQSDAMTEMGCTYLQGYLYSRPLTPEAMTDLLTAEGGKSQRPTHLIA